jgi:CheY-like chemotaxis protein
MAARRTGAARRVLYIEDNEVNRVLMEGMLTRLGGIRLELAELPEQGLALAEREPPHLVLLDIQLPGIDGFDVLRRLRSMPRLAGVPVIAVSANAMPADRERAAAAGFDDYITKPVDMTLLFETVSRLLG